MRSTTSSRCQAPAVLAFWTSMTRRALVRGLPSVLSLVVMAPTLERQPDIFRPDGSDQWAVLRVAC